MEDEKTNVGVGGIYQSKEWLLANRYETEESVDILSFVKTRKIPNLGTKFVLHAEGSDFTEEQLKNFKQIAKKYFYGTIAPCVMQSQSDFRQGLHTQDDLFKKAGFKKVSNYTILVPLLNLTIEQMWHAMEKKSVRWGVKTATANGLKASIASEQDLLDFYKIYSATAQAGHFPAQLIEFLVPLRNTEVSKLIVLKNASGVLVAGGLLLIDKHNGYSILNLAAASEEGKQLQAMPFLYWTMIRVSHKLGLEAMDLGGYNKEVKEGHKEYAINKFKDGFGGSVIEQPIYATNWKYPFLRWVRRKFR